MTDLSSPSQTFLNKLRKNGFADNKPISTFTENFDMGLNVTAYENLSNSQSRVMAGHKQHRMAVLQKAVEEGTIPQEVFNGFRGMGTDWDNGGVEWNLLARYAKKHYGLDVMTDDEIKKGIREDLTIVKKSQQEIESRAGFTGKAGSVLGSLVSYALDPLTIPSYFIGYGEAATGARFLAGLGKVALAEGVTEAAIQTKVYQWKDEISEASLKEAITNVATVVGAVTGIGLTAHALSKSISKFLGKRGVTEAADWYEHKLQQMASEMEDADKAPLPKSIELIEDALDAFEKKFGFRPKLSIIKSSDELPDSVKKSAALRTASLSRVKGVRTKEGEYIAVADAFTTPEEAMGTIWHEAVGHEYFKKHFKRNKLDKIYSKYKDQIVAQNNFGIDVTEVSGRRRAAEEYMVKAFSKSIEKNSEQFKRAIESMTSTVRKSALEQAKQLTTEAEHLNSVHLNKPVRNVTQIEDDVLDELVNRVFKADPEFELPIREELVSGEREIVSRKLSDLLEEFDNHTELVNSFKECIVGG